MNFLYIFLIAAIFLLPESAIAETKNIYVYDDDGVSQRALAQTLTTLKSSSPESTVKTISASEVIQNDWSKNASLFVIPGGADLPYAKKLNGVGNANIKKFVENGGSFLGICAGAYYASSYVEFDKGGDLEVLGSRELAFFPSKSIGPILAKYDYKTNSGARAVDIGKSVVYFNGGGYFENAEKFSNVSVLASYPNKLPAIVFINYGKGKVVLSGVHFEANPDLMNADDPDLKKIIPTLKANNTQREALVKDILKILF